MLSYCSNRIIAFQEACRLGCADVVQTFLEECIGDDLILEKNADGGLNALQIATKNRRSHIVQILLRRYITEKVWMHERSRTLILV